MHRTRSATAARAAASPASSIGPRASRIVAGGAPRQTRARTTIAKHITQVVAPGSDAVVTLRGYDTDGDVLSADVSSLPASGVLSQLSKVFSKFGYDPKKGSAAKAGAAVTGSNDRLHYARPAYDAEFATGKWATFGYTVSDGSATSREATVTLVPPSLNLVATAFDTSAEAWTVVRNGPGNAGAAHDASSSGPR